MRYIDADKLQEEFKELHGGKRSLLIDTEPTVDVAEVVRCKDCRHNGSFDTDCPINWNGKEYCSFAERKENG